MPRKRSTYTAEFKLAAVKMITEQKRSVAEVARRLDVGENLLRTWKKAFLERGDDAFPGHGNPTPADDELRRLRAENARLRAERDLLKKPPRTSPTRRPDLPVHRRPPVRVAGHLDVRGAGGVGLRVLRLGRPTRQPDRAARQELVGAIEEIHDGVQGRYGSPRMTAELNARGYECPEDTAAELMNAHEIKATTPRRFIRTTDSNHRRPVA